MPAGPVSRAEVSYQAHSAKVPGANLPSRPDPKDVTHGRSSVVNHNVAGQVCVPCARIEEVVGH